MHMCARPARFYHRRIRELICHTGDPNLFPELEIPRSTASGWIKMGTQTAVNAYVVTMDDVQLRLEVLKLRKRPAIIKTVLPLDLTDI